MATPRFPGRERSLHVLVVDDEDSVLELARERLEGEGHRVTTLTSVSGLETVIRALSPDIVLIDVMMPGLGGRDLARILARYAGARGTAIILHSSIPMRALRFALDVSQAHGVIHKTNDDVEFFFAFNELVDRLPLESFRRPMMSTAQSGTHRILDDETTTQDDALTPTWFSRTSPGRR